MKQADIVTTEVDCLGFDLTCFETLQVPAFLPTLPSLCQTSHRLCVFCTHYTQRVCVHT
jgi:hypothetical protein